MAARTQLLSALSTVPEFPIMMDACRVYTALFLVGCLGLCGLCGLWFVLETHGAQFLLLFPPVAYAACCSIEAVCRYDYFVLFFTEFSLGGLTVALFGVHPFWQASHWVVMSVCVLGSILYRYTYDAYDSCGRKRKRKKG